MSAAELTAHRIYNKYNLGALPNDVKDQVIILMLNSKSYADAEASEEEEVCMKVSEDVPPCMSADNCLARITESRKQIATGLARPIDEFFNEMEEEYPWLCK